MLKHPNSLTSASTTPALSAVRPDAATMRPALIVASALWVTSAASLFLLVLCILHSAILAGWPFLCLATGFGVYQAVYFTHRYRRGLPLHQPSPSL